MSPTHRLSIYVAAPTEAVFDLIHDYSRRLSWDPFLREAALLDADTARKGATARCIARWRSGGLGMDVVYISFTRPKVAAVEMVRGPWFLGAFHASITQAPIDPRRTRITYAFHFTLTPRWLERPFRPLFTAIFARETRARLQALKAHLEQEPAT